MAIEIKPFNATASGVHHIKKNQTDAPSAPTQDFHVNTPTQPQAPVEMQKSHAMTDVEGIFLAVLNPDESRSRGLQFGNDLLDKLDQIRVQISTGRIDIETLKKIGALANREMNLAVDPKLQTVLKDIQILAAVQLAKLAPNL